MASQTISAARLRAELGVWRGTGHAYTHLADVVRLLISDGRLSHDTRLPAERELAAELGLSRTTVAAAYRALRESGHAVSRRGSGTVTRFPGSRPVHRVASAGADAIDLTTACPAPWAGLRDLNQRTHDAHPEAFLEEGYDVLGLPELRAAVADRYRERGLPTSPDQIMITSGAQHALFLVARTLLRRGDAAMVESPTYPHAREALAAVGARVVEFGVRDQQWDVDGALEVLRRTRPRLAYLIPDHHNPTGASMAPEQRSRLLRAAAAAGTVLVVDETTAELSFDPEARVVPFAAQAAQTVAQSAQTAAQAAQTAAQPTQTVAQPTQTVAQPTQTPGPRRAQTVTPASIPDGTVVTLGSLSKTVWGGLRIGWIRAERAQIAAFESARRVGDLGTSTWEQFLALGALEEYPRILGERAAALAEGERTLREGLAARLPAWQVPRVEGGVCTWARLDAPVSSALAVEASRHGLLLSAGPRFGARGAFEQNLRLPFCLPVPLLEAAVDRLAEAHGALRPGAVPEPPSGTVI